jgi:opacity protein-like surface antigen
MNFRKSNSYLLAACMLLGSTTAISAGPATWYAGVSAGTTTIDANIENTGSGAVYDDQDNGFKIFVGRKSKVDGVPGVESLGLEAFYTDMGESKLTGNNGSTFSYNGTGYTMTANTSVSVEGSALGVGGILFFPVTKKAEISAKVGLAKWDFEAKNTATAGGFSLSESTIDFYFGIGASYQLSENIAVGFEHERYTLSDNLRNTDFTSVNLQYMF